MPPNTAVRVQIFGKVHQLRTDDDPDHVRRVAELVDAKMGLIADHGVAADSYSVAVLAALDIADELLRLRDQHAHGVSEDSDRLAALLDRVENAAEDGEPLLPAAD